MRYKEIGSEYWNGCSSLTGCGIKPSYLVDFDYVECLSGRTALDLIVKDLLKNKKVDTVYMPSLCCHSMLTPFLENNIKPIFYDVSWNGDNLTYLYDSNNDADIVFLIDLFGFVSEELLSFSKLQKSLGKTVIYDATHSIFCNVDSATFDYVFGSYRKWLDVNAGFCAKKGKFAINSHLGYKADFIRLRNEAFYLKSEYMLGRNVDKSDFLRNFSLAEKIIDREYINFCIDERSKYIMNSADYDYIRVKRRENAMFLTEKIIALAGEDISLYNKSISEDSCPLFVPVWVNNRDELKQFLINNNIYCPVHWPIPIKTNVFYSMQVNDIYAHELSLVCDQRYGIDEMKYIVEVVSRFIKGKNDTNC